LPGLIHNGGDEMTQTTKIIVLSGSVRFMRQFQEQYVRIAREGNILYCSVKVDSYKK